MGIFGHGDRVVEKSVTETEDIIGTVVDMAKLTDEYLIQYQLYIDATRNTAVNYTEEQKNELIKRAEEVKQQIDRLISDSYLYDDMATVAGMKKIVPEYVSNHSVYEKLDKQTGIPA